MFKIRHNRILLVEDEPILAIIEKTGLEKYGYKITAVDSGEKAIDLICNKKEPVDLILMDIDLGSGMDGTDAAQKILNENNIPILFLSSHTEKEIVEKTEKITSYGYVVKNSSFTVLDASIKMAYKLFYEKRKAEIFDKYLKFALYHASEPIFISDVYANIIFCNEAYLNLTGADNYNYASEFSEYRNFVKIFSDKGECLAESDWASTRGLKGLSNENEIFYVYNSRLNSIQVNYYTYAPIYDEGMEIIGSYVKVGEPITNPEESVIKKIKSSI